MKNLVCVSLLLLGLPAFSAITRTLDATEGRKINKDKECDILMAFGSYSSGIDRETFGNTLSYITKSTLISDALQIYWGKEGEFDLCIKLQSASDSDSVFKELKSQIPATSKKGWTSIKQKGKTTFKNKWPD